MAKHPKRPRDPNQLAKHIVDIATGEVADQPPPQPSPKAVVGAAGGRKGGPSRAESLSGEQRAEIARKAAAARWGRST